MGRWYTGVVTSLRGNRYTIDIYNDAYTGDVEELAIDANSLSIKWVKDGTFAPVALSSMTMTVTASRSDQYLDLMMGGDLDSYVVVTRNGKIYFKGFIETGTYTEEFDAPPYSVRIDATDGLKKLENYSMDITPLYGKGYYNLIEVMRMCLQPLGLRNLYVNSSLYSKVFKADRSFTMFDFSWVHCDSFKDEENLLELLKAIIAEKGCLYQKDGDWYLERRRNKINSGTVSYVKYDLLQPYDVVTNRGSLVTVTDRAKVIETNGDIIISGSATRSRIKEYGVQKVTLDISKRSSLFNQNYADAIAYAVKYVASGNPTTGPFKFGGQWNVMSDAGAHSTEAFAPMCWYRPSSIEGQTTFTYTAIADKYGMAAGMQMDHATGHSYVNHIAQRVLVKATSGCGGELKFKVKVTLGAGMTKNKRYLVLPLSVYFVNTRVWCDNKQAPPSDGWIKLANAWDGKYKDDYQCKAGNGDVKSYSSRQNILRGDVVLWYDSFNNPDEYAAITSDEGYEVSLTLPPINANQRNSPDLIGEAYVVLYAAQGGQVTCRSANADNTGIDADVTTDKSMIAMTAYGDVTLTLDEDDTVETSYDIKLIDDDSSAVVCNREAPELSLKYWEGPPTLTGTTSREPNRYWVVNAMYRYLIMAPATSDMYTTDVAGNITGVKTYNGSIPAMPIKNMVTCQWYDRDELEDNLNAPALLIERIAQERFENYAVARESFEATVEIPTGLDMSHTLTLRNNPGKYYVADTIEHDVENDDYAIKLEQVIKNVHEVVNFIPRVK